MGSARTLGAVNAAVTTSYAMTHRLVQHRLTLLLTTSLLAGAESARVARLAAGALALVRQHGVDDKGRCRFCTRRRRWHRVRARPCTVHATFSAYLTQPDALVHRQITELLRHHERRTDATAPTLRIPRASDW